MDEQACPKCKTTTYRNPQMRLLVNVCGHNLCESCVELLFVKGSGSCPECGIALRRNNFRFQFFEDASIDKAVDIRKRVLRDFNLKEEDFGTLREYNDYLEMVEDIIFNLVNDIDVQETNRRIAVYKQKNKDQIAKNRHRMSHEALELEGIILEESRVGGERQRQAELEQRTEKELKEARKEKLIDDLMFSDCNASDIVNKHAEEQREVEEERNKRIKFSTGLDVRTRGNAETAVLVEGEAFTYDRPDPVREGPPLPTNVEQMSVKHIKASSVQDRAGGYKEQIPCLRALQEAMDGLFFPLVGT